MAARASRIHGKGPGLALCSCLVLALADPAASAPPTYAWLLRSDRSQALHRRIPPPAGFERMALPEGSFGEWLRGLPLKPGRPAVHLYDGRLKANQNAHAAVIDIDVGSGDLQQCADAVIRLRAEYLWSVRDLAAIRFRFTSGDPANYTSWRDGERPEVAGSRVRWIRTAAPDPTYEGFRRYLVSVFTYAGSLSLGRELAPVADPREVRPGDVFVQGGSPGHAVLVLDVAIQPASGRRLFLLAQSYMPAQDVHVLRNPGDAALSPWYTTDFGDALETPEWTFRARDLRRF